MALERQEILDYFAARTPAMVEKVKELVEYESWTHDPASLKVFADVVADYMYQTTGVSSVIHHADDGRPHLQIDLGDSPDVMLMGHIDTAHQNGLLAQYPTRIEGDKLFGLGALDMKSGLVIIAEVVSYIQQFEKRPNIRIFLDSDEEGGSLSSGPIIRSISTETKIAMVFEMTNREGLLKIGARGARRIRVRLKGKGGHAAYPEHYRNPVDAMADIMMKLRELHDPRHGVVVTPTIVHGSHTVTVVPDEAELQFDTRAVREELLDMVENTIRNFQVLEGIEMEVDCIFAVPVFEYREDNHAYELAKNAAPKIGMQNLEGVEARGASDTNQIASVCRHAIEGLGGWGQGMHNAPHEHVLISSLAPSAALTTLMIEEALGLKLK